MVNAIVYHPEGKGVDLDGIGAVLHKYANSSSQHTCDEPRVIRVCPVPVDGGRIGCAGNAGHTLVSVVYSMVDLGTADHETYIIYGGSTDPMFAMKYNGLTRIRRLHNTVRCRYAAGTGTDDNPHGVSDMRSGMPTGTSPSSRRHEPAFSNVGDGIGRFRGRRKRNYVCLKNHVISHVVSDGVINSASCHIDMALGSRLTMGNVDGQTVADHETDGFRWGQMSIYIDANALKVHADGPARHNWSPDAYILARFKHHNIQPLWTSDGIPPIEQKNQEVCSTVLGPSMHAHDIWRVQ